MGIRERREREKSEVRDKILDAARELFATQGYEAVTMRKIAEAIEYSPTAIYLHFADKETLMQELCAHDFGSLALSFKEMAAIADPVARIRALGEGFIQFALNYPNHYRLMFMTPHQAKDISEAEWEKRGDPERDSYAQLQLAVTEAHRQGRFRPEYTDPELIAQTFAAAVQGIASMYVVMRDDPWIEWRPLEERTRVLLDAVLRGLCRDGEDVGGGGGEKAGRSS